MHPEERALTAAVVAAADDDLPRLVLADWLEEHDQPDRAAFVRAQCRVAAAEPWDAVAVRARHFPAETDGSPWLGTLPAVDGRDLSWHPTAAFRRGFGWALVVRDLTTLLADAPRLFAEAPIGELHLPTATLAEWRRFAAAAWLPRVKSIHFYGTATPIEPVSVLCETPLATGLERIHFGWAGSPAMPELVERLFRSPLGGQLRGLTFRSPVVDATFVEALSHAPAAGPPLDLRFEIGRFIPTEAFTRLPVLDRLNGLKLTDTLGPSGWMPVLLSARPLPGPRQLALRNGGLWTESVPLLADSASFARLQSLDLGGNEVIGKCDAGWRSLTERVVGLNAERTGLRVEVLRQICNGSGGLVELNLSGNKLTDRATKVLIEAPFSDSLAALVVRDTGLRPAALRKLRDRFGDRLVADDA